VFENRVLRRIFGSKRDEITRDWKGLHNEKLHYLYSSRKITGNIEERMRWVGHLACMGEMRGAYRVLVEKPEVKSPFGRPRRGGKDNIKTNLKKIG
jgi:hypothetical protein